MSYQQYKTVSFGASKAGLSTVGYSLYDNANTIVGIRLTGVDDIGDGSYGALVAFDDGFQGRITWDTGEGSPAYASEDINDYRIDMSQSVPIANLSTATTQNLGECLSASRADAVGNMVLDVGAKTQTIYGPDGTVVRLFAIDDINTPTSRN